MQTNTALALDRIAPSSKVKGSNETSNQQIDAAEEAVDFGEVLNGAEEETLQTVAAEAESVQEELLDLSVESEELVLDELSESDDIEQSINEGSDLLMRLDQSNAALTSPEKATAMNKTISSDQETLPGKALPEQQDEVLIGDNGVMTKDHEVTLDQVMVGSGLQQPQTGVNSQPEAAQGHSTNGSNVDKPVHTAIDWGKIQSVATEGLNGDSEGNISLRAQRNGPEFDASLARSTLTPEQGANPIGQEFTNDTGISPIGQVSNTLSGLQKLEQAQQVAAPMPMQKEMVGEQVADRLQMMMSKNLKNIDIRLDPPELGRMQIRMTMNGDVANVQIAVANTQVRDMIEQSLPRLREMMAQNGVTLADTSVQQQQSGHQQAHQQQTQTSQSDTLATHHDFVDDEMDMVTVAMPKVEDGISYFA